MAGSGCYQITIACESGSQRVLDELIDKRLPLETIYPAIAKAKKSRNASPHILDIGLSG